MTSDPSPLYGPLPGDVFREYTWKDDMIRVCWRGNQNPAAQGLCATFPDMKEYCLDIGDLDGALKAEMVFEYWGGHLGTSDQKFKVNGGEFIPLPQPVNAPTAPEWYCRNLLGPAVPILLSDLKVGRNVFQFASGPQTKYNFDWSWYFGYAFTVRVYYDAAKPHPTAQVTSPAPGSSIGDWPLLESARPHRVDRNERVDYVGYYEDFDWEGNGIYRQWHYQYRFGEMTRHLGTAVTAVPYGVVWDTTWLPDQDEPIKIMARITDRWTGISTMTEAVDSILLVRPNRSVRMYKPYDVPENFGVRVGQRKGCKIDVNGDLSRARAARLVLAGWSMAHADEIGLNGHVVVQRVGRTDDYSYSVIEVPLDALREGTNEFYLFSGTEHHAAEVCWPGPVLMVAYDLGGQR